MTCHFICTTISFCFKVDNIWVAFPVCSQHPADRIIAYRLDSNNNKVTSSMCCLYTINRVLNNFKIATAPTDIIVNESNPEVLCHFFFFGGAGWRVPGPGSSICWSLENSIASHKWPLTITYLQNPLLKMHFNLVTFHYMFKINVKQQSAI